jgi:hypothetical protein
VGTTLPLLKYENGLAIGCKLVYIETENIYSCIGEAWTYGKVRVSLDMLG